MVLVAHLHLAGPTMERWRLVSRPCSNPLLCEVFTETGCVFIEVSDAVSVTVPFTLFLSCVPIPHRFKFVGVQFNL